MDQHNYTEQQVEIFDALDRKSDEFYNKSKNFSIVFFVGALFLIQLYMQGHMEYIKPFIEDIYSKLGISNFGDFQFDFDNKVDIGLAIFIGLIVYPILVWFVKHNLYKAIREQPKKFELKKPRVVKFILSPDAFFSELYKDRLIGDLCEDVSTLKDSYTIEGVIIKQPITRKFFVKCSEVVDYIIIISLIFLTLIGVYLNLNRNDITFFFIFLFYKLNSKMIELSFIEKKAVRIKYGIDLESWNQVKIEKKFFIEWSNWINCVITVCLCIITFIWIYWNCNENSLAFLFTVLLYRIFSRGIEIALSFYKDVVNNTAKIVYQNGGSSKYILGFKSSLIRSRGRLSLAIHSLIELTILYSGLYFINNILTSPLEDVVLTPFNSLLFSASLGVFNISFSYEDPYLSFPQSLLHVSQVLLSVILILLSIAQYVGANDDLSKQDEELYLKAELKKQER